MRSMTDVDIIIPCYGKSELINRGLASLATQWKREYIHVILVDDCSPNTDCHYQDLVDRYKNDIDICCIVTPKNCGQGLTRQYGIDHSKHKWFMFMDEDDMYTPLSISQFVGAMESYGMIMNEDGTVALDNDGNPMYEEGLPEVGVVSGPLFEFDDNHTHVIPSENRIWLNAKLYNREFINKHNIYFNEDQSRHAEDYYYMSCFFHALDNDPNYIGILLGDEGLYYIWYPNEESQSRIDPHYGFMLSGYTMQGSVNIMNYIKDSKRSNIEWSDEIQEQYDRRLLNSTVYSFYTFLSYLKHVAETDYVPKLEQDWYLLRDACNEMRYACKNNWDKYPYMKRVEELFLVKNNTDVQYTEPWITFDDYIQNGMDEFGWTFDDLMDYKKKNYRLQDKE